MNILTFNVKEMGAKIEKEGEYLSLKDSSSDEYQVVCCNHNCFLNSVIKIECILEFDYYTNKNFVIHHVNFGDILSIQKKGKIDFIENKFISNFSIAILSNDKIKLSVTFFCYAEEFWFGLGAPKTKYRGSDQFHLRISEFNVSASKLDIDVRELPIETMGPLYVAGHNTLTCSANNGKVRLIIPIHSPKIPYLLDLLRTLDSGAKSSHTGVCEVLLVLNRSEDYNLYRYICVRESFSFSIDYFFVEDFLKSANLEGALRHLSAGADRGIAVFKKLVALYALSLNKQDNKYNICIDADSQCIRWDANFGRRIVENYNKKTFFGVPVINDITRKINESSFRLLSPNSTSEIKIRSDIYTWFFDIPTYLTQDLRGFFEFIHEIHEYLDVFFSRLSWFTFEHKVFIFYLLREGGKIIDYSDENKELIRVVPEALNASNLLFIAWKYDYCPLWVRAGAVEKASKLANELLNPYFLYHTDRS